MGGEGRSENECVKEAQEQARSMASSSLLSSCNGLEAMDGTLESTVPVSGEERTGYEEDSGGALFIASLWNIEHVCKVSTSVDDGPTVVST